MVITYILFSEKLNEFYAGACGNLIRRIAEHNSGKSKFTALGMPWKIVYKETHPTLQLAKQREAEIKKRKSRKYILDLIEGRASRY